MQYAEHFLEPDIVNPHDFEYIINPGNKVCSDNKGENIFLIAFVPTSPSNYKNRLALRETWANMLIFPDLRVLFMLGNRDNKKISKLIQYESETYGDIVQENFYDSYRNLTYKGIMALRLISEYCPKVKYILKLDDDILVNMYYLMKHLKALYQFGLDRKNTILGFMYENTKIIRRVESKWFTTHQEMEGTHYQPYCGGAGFILTSDLAPIFYEASLYLKFFHIED
jgi:beta-1,3-galactosyltransferase 1